MNSRQFACADRRAKSLTVAPHHPNIESIPPMAKTTMTRKQELASFGRVTRYSYKGRIKVTRARSRVVGDHGRDADLTFLIRPNFLERRICQCTKADNSLGASAMLPQRRLGLIELGPTRHASVKAGRRLIRRNSARSGESCFWLHCLRGIRLQALR